MEFRILGPLQICDNHGQPSQIGPVHARIVATLLLSANQVVDWSHLIDAVWNDDPPTTAKRQVQNAISALRRQLTAAGSTAQIVTSGHAGYQIHIGEGQLDAEVYLRVVGRAHDMASRGRHDQAVADFNAALALWRGPALSGLDGDTLRAAAAGLDEHRLTTIEHRLRLELDLGHHESIVSELAELERQHPLRESLVGQLMLALHRCGRRAEALYAFERLRGRLAEDLGIDPGADLQRIYVAILRDQANPPKPVSPPDAAVGPPDVPRQLPSPIRHFVGRLAELKELTGLIDESPGSPLTGRTEGSRVGVRVFRTRGLV